MMNPIHMALAVAATASLGLAHGDGPGPDGDKSPLLDGLFDGHTRVTYTPGHGVTFAAQDGFSINISGQIQPGFMWSSVDYSEDPATGAPWGEDADSSSFGLKSTRLRFGGNVMNDDIGYLLQLDADGSLVDAFVTWDMGPFGLRFGRQKFRSSLQADASLSDTDLEFSDVSLATSTFANIRGDGILLTGSTGDIGYHAGLLNHGTAGVDEMLRAEEENDNLELNVTVGVNYGTVGANTEDWSEGDLEHSGTMDYLVGANWIRGQDVIDLGGLIDDRHSTLNVYAGLKTGTGIAVQGEYFARDDDVRATGTSTWDSLDCNGYYVQASYTLAPGDSVQWGLAARYSEVNDIVLMDGAVTQFANQGQFDIGVNAYHHKHRLKTQVNVSWNTTEWTTPGNAVFSATGDWYDSVGVDVLFTLMF